MTLAKEIYPLLFFVLLFQSPVQADLYRWQDSQGVWHVTDNQEKIPHEYRDAVDTLVDRPQAAQTPPKNVDLPGARMEDLPQRLLTGVDRSFRPPAKHHNVPYTQTRSSLIVQTTINDDLTLPLILDTGATFTTLSRETAKRLGTDLSGILPRIQLSTANGIIGAHLVRLRSVQLGGARVEDITALIPEQDNLGTHGLLGLNFLNEFDWSNDTRNGRLVLTEFVPDPSEETCGGRSRQWWQKKFAEVKERVRFEERLLNNLENVDEQGPIESDVKDRYLEVQRANVSFFRKELNLLDNKANRAMVPRSWR
ncbi:MAG: TIGR02281 family clan AA aspartic protease [bacterium]|nr:TIGR02281 family clan AA aspartic protease [bacterium]